MEDEYVQVKRTVINKKLMNELNILMYNLPQKESIKDAKDTKDVKEIKKVESPWKDFIVVLPKSKNNKEDKDNVLKESKRNDGFFILSNKIHISRHLKKTKFCNIFLQEGVCNRKICNFAHSIEEYNFPNCAFNENCKVKNCKFKHPYETLEEFKKRINFQTPFEK